MSKAVLFEKNNGIVLVTINRPEAMNAVNNEVRQGLDDAVAAIEDSKGTMVLVLTGAGELSFSAGGDIREWLNKPSPKEGRHGAAWMHNVLDRLENLPWPTIAAVNGYAIGGGCELALACDVRFASEKAVFQMSEVTLGLIPGWGGSQRLPSVIPSGVALDMIITGEPISAERAYQCGLVSRLFPHETLLSETLKVARRIAAFSSDAIRLVKEGIRAGMTMGPEAARQREIDLFEQVWGTPGHRQAIEDFLSRGK